MSPQPHRTRLPLFVLWIGTPVVAEMLSGATPIAMYLNPIAIVIFAAFYGAAAVLAREVVRRRQLGWANLFLLGAAFGIINEGLTVTSWFNPLWPDVTFLGPSDWIWHTNLLWALCLTAFHMLISLVIPIVLVEAIFPQRAAIPWLGRKGFIGFAIMFLLAALLSYLFSARRADFVAAGYEVPQPQYLILFLFTTLLIAIAVLHRWPDPLPRDPRPAPRLWSLRWFAFGMIVLFYLIFWGKIIPNALITSLALLAIITISLWRVRSLAQRQGWDRRHILALATGYLGLWVLLTPFEELFLGSVSGRNTHGQSIVGLAFAVLLIWLARRTAREPTPPQQSMQRNMGPIRGIPISADRVME